MQQPIMRPPGFPVVPFLFPMGVALLLLGVTAWFSYQNWKELDAIRQARLGDLSRT